MSQREAPREAQSGTTRIDPGARRLILEARSSPKDHRSLNNKTYRSRKTERFEDCIAVDLTRREVRRILFCFCMGVRV